MGISVNSELLLAVAKWAHRYHTERPNLSAIYFREREMVATDGCRLVRVPINGAREFSVRRADAFAAVHAQNAWYRHHNDFAMRLDADLEAGNDGETIWAMGDRQISIEWDGGASVKFDLGGCVLSSAAGTGTLPPIDSVMLPRRAGDVPWGQGFDVRYLAGIEDVVRAAGYSSYQTVVEAWEDYKLTPYQFACPGEGDAEDRIRFVVMPLAKNPGNAKRANAEIRRRAERRSKPPRA